MSKVLLISANKAVEPYPVYPLALSILASALSGAGHETRQFDILACGGNDKLKVALREFDPNYVCISFRNIDTVDSVSDQWFLDDYRDLVAQVRSASQARIIVGGAGFSLLPEEILNHVGADLGVVGEGELSLPKLIGRLENGEIVSRVTGPASADELFAPAMDEDLAQFYLGESGILGLQTKRGCAHHCTYCSYPSLEGHVVRTRPPEEVVEDLRRMVALGANFIFFTDAVFNDTGGRYLELAEALAGAELPLTWSAYFRPCGMGPADLALLRRAGLAAMEVGTDAACDTSLAGLAKDFRFEDVVRFQDMCEGQRIPCAHFVIFGGPGETPATVEEGVANLEKLSSCVVFAFSGIRLHPDTSIYRLALAQGVITPDTSLLRPVFYFSPGVEPEGMNLRLEEAFRGRRDRVFPPSRGHEQMAVMHRMGYRGLLWDTLIRFPKESTA